MNVIEGQESESVSNLTNARSTTARVLKKAWQEISKVEYDMLHSITFGELVDRIKRQGENMYYI